MRLRLSICSFSTLQSIWAAFSTGGEHAGSLLPPGGKKTEAMHYTELTKLQFAGSSEIFLAPDLACTLQNYKRKTQNYSCVLQVLKNAAVRLEAL